jgi:NAD(P)-dependent dehydrogenase (short-subunit alcohol dehydrogenase family)
MRLENNVALITGAGSGMGRVACEMFAREGCAVVATDVNAAAVRETGDLVSSAGGRILAIDGDVSRAADVQRWVDEAVRVFGKLNVLYNNAGIFPDEDGAVTDMDEATYQRVLDVNLRGVMLCCKYGVPELVRAGGGSIVNVASFVALVGCSVPQDVYTASKGAVLSLTRSLAVQYGPQRVRRSASAPTRSAPARS